MVPAVRSVLPEAAPVLRGLAAVVAAVLVAVSLGPPGSATAVAGAGAVAGAAALQDRPRGRILRVLFVSVLMGASALLGALTSSHSPVFIASAAVWCFAAALAWALGGHAGLIASAAGALMVVAAPVPPTWASTVGAAGRCSVAGALQAVVVAVWLPRRWRMQHDALTAAYRALAADASRLAHRSGDGGFAHADSMIALRAVFTPATGPATRHPADYRRWYLLPERIGTALTDVAETADAAEVLTAAADTLTAVADPRRAAREAADEALRRLDDAVAQLPAADAAAGQRLSAHLHEAAAMRLGDFVPSSPDALRVRRPDLRTSGRAAVSQLRAEIDRHSPVFRHAVRLGAAVAAACAAERYTAVGHGGWIALTVLIVLRPETAHTYTRCVGRTAGVALGAVLASAVLLILRPGPVVTGVLAAVAIGVVYAAGRYGYLALAAASAGAIALIVAIDRPIATATPGELLIGTVIGGALAVLAHVVFPDDALTRLAQRAGELLKTEIDYAATVVKVYLHELDTASDVRAAAWERTFRARAAFEAAAGAARLESREQRHWLRCYRSVLNAVTSSCAALEGNLPVDPFPDSHRVFLHAVDEFVEALCGEPPTPTDPWTVDAVELAAAAQRVRRTVPVHESDEGSARVLVGEIAAITRQLSLIAATPWPTAQR
ncbi:FUSC family protein [Mycolicibacterium psychrotolerans]|uniref:FUSC family protein n=1 Tax=Mycolicibacterium psychrotolerans TaxID=216929 RepID=UPI0021F36ABD|nr:FUSC family protein [Mycolicibacterium psychrotolerans]